MVDILCLSSSGKLSKSDIMFLSIFQLRRKKKETETQVLGFTKVCKGFRFFASNGSVFWRTEKRRKASMLKP